jgi:surfactin synthase thioesterase subunit
MSRVVGQILAEALNIPSPTIGLFGHCVGSLIAFELAHKLVERRPDCSLSLFVASHVAPSVQPSKDARQLDVRAQLRQLGATPQAVLDNDELFELIRPAIEADYRMGNSYESIPRAALPVPITVFLGDEDETSDERYLAWKKETSKAFRLEYVGGGHMLVGPSWEHAGRLIGSAILEDKTTD